MLKKFFPSFLLSLWQKLFCNSIYRGEISLVCIFILGIFPDPFLWLIYLFTQSVCKKSRAEIFTGIQKNPWVLAQSLIENGVLSPVDEIWLIQLCRREILLHLEGVLGPNLPILQKIRALHSVPTELGQIIL